MSFANVGKVWDAAGFAAYLETLPPLDWARSVTVHHTAYPDLSMRPKGWTIQHMRNLEDYYGRKKRWSAGPHLFTDEDQIFGLSPLTARGVHARSFNADSIGLEALGNYDQESPHEGRGREVWYTTAAAVALLLAKLGLEPNPETVKFHRDDPRTTKRCPGRKVEKEWFLNMVRSARTALKHGQAQDDRAGEDDLAGAPGDGPERAEILGRLETIEREAAAIRKALG
jgi:hypothetical protein